MQSYNSDKLQYEIPDSEDHFLPEPQGDVTKGADKRQVQLVRVICSSSVFSASEYLNTLVKV
jgi:hypothetical protein